MTIIELRAHPEYGVCVKKIESYRKGFEFKLEWHKIPRAKANALRIILKDCTAKGLITPIADDWSLDMVNTSTTYRRL